MLHNPLAFAATIEADFVLATGITFHHSNIMAQIKKTPLSA